MNDYFVAILHERLTFLLKLIAVLLYRRHIDERAGPDVVREPQRSPRRSKGRRAIGTMGSQSG